MAGDLVTFIQRDRLCVACLAVKMGRPPDEVTAAVQDLSRTVRVSVQIGICAGCGLLRMTHTLS